MKYGIIADVHGNYPALKAVVENGISKGVETFIYVGDYFGDMPFPNEVCELMNNKSNYIIRGNKEDYLTELHMSARSQWKHIQFAALYWSYDEFSEENLFELINLPENITIKDKESNKEIFVTHSITEVFKETSLNELTSHNFSIAYEKKTFSHEAYIDGINKQLNNDHLLNVKMNNETADIYIFGHTHLQWHSQVGNKLFINPGSCGKPLDYNVSAPYTILELTNTDINIEEVRVVYDIKELISQIKSSDLYTKAKDWSNIVIDELNSGKDDVSFFFQHLYQIAKECGEDSWPVTTFVWDEAINRWKRGENND